MIQHFYKHMPNALTERETIALAIAWGEWRDVCLTRYGFRKVFSRFHNPFTEKLMVFDFQGAHFQ